MKIVDFTIEKKADSAQYCTDDTALCFYEEGLVEFRTYCMINSMAEPVGLEIEQVDENNYTCVVLTTCEMPAMSERCVLVSGKLLDPDRHCSSDCGGYLDYFLLRAATR